MFDDESGIVLNDRQQNMMERWNTVIELKTCELLSQRELVERLMSTYVISRVTAFNDIGSAEALFGYSTPLNKRFRIGARINFLEEKINELYTNKDYDNAAKLESSLAKYYDMYPELKTQQRPQNLVFSFKGKAVTDNVMPIEDAEFTLLQAANG